MRGTLAWLLLTSTTFSEGSFYISQDESRWSDQNHRNCTPVTPKVEAAADTEYLVTEDLGVDIPLNEHVWVGYYQVKRVFEYIGCISMTNLINYEDRPYIKIKGDPGQCFPGCGDDIIIGVTRTRCYCLGSDFNVQDRTETECTDPCNGPFVACGNDFTPIKYSYLSIYKMNTNATIVHGATEGQNCLTMDPTVPKLFIWDKCTVYLPPMCSFGDYVRLIKPKGEMVYGSWTDAANECFNYNAFPTIYSNSKHVDLRNGSRLWTGIFTTNVVYRHDNVVPANRRHDPKRFGYLSGDSENNIKLQFTETESANRRLCDDGQDSKKVTATSLSSNMPYTTTANIGETPATSSFDTIITLGVCGFVVLILVVSVTLVCFRRKRKKNRLLKKDDDINLSPLNGRCDNDLNYSVPNIIGNATFDSTTEDKVLDAKKDDQDYSIIETENVYNQLYGKETYDHPITNNQSDRSNQTENEMDETYDKSSVATNMKCYGKHLDNIYDQNGGTEEDEYNHLGSQDVNLKTDNVYGIHGKHKEDIDSEYDTSVLRHCKSNDHTDNTYSCL